MDNQRVPNLEEMDEQEAHRFKKPGPGPRGVGPTPGKRGRKVLCGS